jgi:hypothetical protein
MAELEFTASFSLECNFCFATRMWRPPQSGAEMTRSHMDRATSSFYLLTHAIVNL